MRTIPLRVFAILLFAAACGERTVNESDPQLTTRTDLLVSTEWLASRLQDPGLVVVHVGTQANHDAGHVPGARLVLLAPLQPTTNDIPLILASPQVLRNDFEEAGVSAQSNIVTGDGFTQATRGFFILDYLDHPRVSLLDGGKQAWQAENRPLSTDRVTPTRGSMGTTLRAERLAVSDWVNQNRQRDGIVLVDARPPADYAGDVQPNANLPRPGHIPGAWNVSWPELVTSTAVPRLKDVASLRSLYEEFVPTRATRWRTASPACSRA